MTIDSSLSVAYTCDSSADERALVLEAISSLRQGKDGAIDLFALYPPVSAELFPSLGTLSVDEPIFTQPVTELIQFNATKRAALKYPIGWRRSATWWQSDYWSGTGCDSGGGVSGGGRVSHAIVQAYDSDGREARPHITFDRDAGELVAAYAITGIVRASYTASYKRIRLSRSGENQLKATGNLIALYRGVSAEASFGSVAPSEPIPVYDVVSEYIVDREGAWEVPDGWPEQENYPLQIDEHPDPDNYRQLERIHESCYLDWNGEMRYEKYILHHEQPYESAVNYTPKYRFDRGPDPGADSSWAQAWARIDWGSIQADLMARYSGIEGF